MYLLVLAGSRLREPLAGPVQQEHVLHVSHLSACRYQFLPLVERRSPGSTPAARRRGISPRSGPRALRAGTWQTRGMSAAPLAEPMAPASAGLHEPCVLLKLGEVVLKGGNRQQFEHMLHANIRRAMAELGITVRLWQRDGVIVVRIVGGDAGTKEAAKSGARPAAKSEGSAEATSEAGAEVTSGAGAEASEIAGKIAERARDIMGIARVCRAVRVSKEPGAAIEAAVALMAGKTGSFAVPARRRDKRFPLTSAQLATEIGTRVQQAYGYPVNLRHPDAAVFVEVDRREVFVYTEGYAGQGGLPVGMSGRALVLMSGGIDSPVAAYRMMRRGLRCDFLHFSGMPLTGPESVYKAYGLMHQLDRFQCGSRLFVVAFGKTQQRLAASGASRLQIVAQRRLMLKTAEVLAG